jgi:hypothetical protein
MAKARKSIPKSTAVESNLATAMQKLALACEAGDSAVAVRSKDGKKLASTVKRLAKRKASLLKRKKTTTVKVAREPNRENRSALKAVIKDLAKTGKELDKARGEKAANLTELNALRSAQKRANAYKKAIAQANKSMNKKPRRTKR